MVGVVVAEYEGGLEDAESWLEVIPKYYVTGGKNGCGIVLRRERPVDEVASVDEVADLESSDDEIESASDSSSSSGSDSDVDESQEERQQAKSKRPRS